MIELEHGTFRAHEKHRRDGTEPCDLCRAARRGYEQGYKNAVAKTAKRIERAARPAQLAEQALEVCRGLVHRRPVPLLREAAVAIIREADANLCVDETAA